MRRTHTHIVAIIVFYSSAEEMALKEKSPCVYLKLEEKGCKANGELTEYNPSSNKMCVVGTFSLWGWRILNFQSAL